MQQDVKLCKKKKLVEDKTWLVWCMDLDVQSLTH